MKKIILLLIVFCFLVTGCSFSKNEEKIDNIGEISVTEVKKIVDNYEDYPDVDIIDVRNEDEFSVGHIEGAINIPLFSIEKIQIDTDRELIVYCQSGKRSKEAIKILKELGYENILDMGGIENWPYELVDES